MSGFTGFKNTTFKTSVGGDVAYKGRTICYENGRRLWQETSKIFRLSRSDALKDAQMMSIEHIKANFHNQ